MFLLIRNLVITCVLVGFIAFLLCRKMPDLQRRISFVIIVGVFSIMIFWLTGVSPVNGFQAKIDFTRIQMIPFQGIRTVLYYGVNLYAVENILGNVIMLMPIGFLLPLLFKMLRKWWVTMVIGAGLSLLIELSQLFLARGTDIDDVILNTMGALIGYMAWKLTGRFFEKYIHLEDTTPVWNLLWIPAILIPYVVEVVMGIIDRIWW